MTLDNKINISRDVIFNESVVPTTPDYSWHVNDDMDELLDASFFHTNIVPYSNPGVLTQQVVPLQQSAVPPPQQSATLHGPQVQPLPQVQPPATGQFTDNVNQYRWTLQFITPRS